MQQQQQQQRSQQPPMHHDEHVYTHAHQPTHPASVRTIAPPQGQGWNLKLLRQFLDHPAWHHTSRAGKGQIMGRGGEQHGDAHVGARADQNCKYLPAGCAPTALELQPGAAIPNTAKVREAEGKESWQGSVAAARWRVAHRPATQATRHQRVRQEATEGVV